MISTTIENWKWQYGHPNRKYLYLRKYDRYHHGELEKLFLQQDRQPEMAAETGINYISGTTTYTIEIITANGGFSTTANPKEEVLASECDSAVRSEMVIRTPKPLCCHFRLSVVVSCAYFIRAGRRKPRIVIPAPMSRLFGETSCELPVVENFYFATRIASILTLEPFDRISQQERKISPV